MKSVWQWSEILISRTLDFSKTPITRTKSRFPWICNYYSLSPIFRNPRRLEKSGFHCIFGTSLQDLSNHSLHSCSLQVRKDFASFYRRQEFMKFISVGFLFPLVILIINERTFCSFCPYGARKNTTQLAKYSRVLYVKPSNKYKVYV